ncbi:chymotrypsin-like protease CTRL-1 [Anopheles cruzii]|uniref:chymotrypsin-like protease CTRL-1 n=1 Tax=Anopheles cruzii TaxID=68878 RepID=UPI0022EC57D5|nr:chymotrypsin-like protease CTRL-1 [Anopheles cruzii]
MGVVPLQDEEPGAAPPVSCFAVGWGDTSFPESSDWSTEHLKIGHYRLVTRKACVEQWATRGQIITEEMLCAHSKPANVCAGDSGGPFVCDGRLYGIVSFTTFNCSNELPQGFTRVSAPKIRSFIRAVAAV